MIADVDVASIITGLQSGAAWRYRMIFVMDILTIRLFIIQDATGESMPPDMRAIPLWPSAFPVRREFSLPLSVSTSMNDIMISLTLLPSLIFLMENADDHHPQRHVFRAADTHQSAVIIHLNRCFTMLNGHIDTRWQLFRRLMPIRHQDILNLCFICCRTAFARINGRLK